MRRQQKIIKRVLFWYNRLDAKLKFQKVLWSMNGFGRSSSLLVCAIFGLSKKQILGHFSRKQRRLNNMFFFRKLVLSRKLIQKRANWLVNMMTIGSKRFRVRKLGLPVRGQRTRTNASTARRLFQASSIRKIQKIKRPKKKNLKKFSLLLLKNIKFNFFMNYKKSYTKYKKNKTNKKFYYHKNKKFYQKKGFHNKNKKPFIPFKRKWVVYKRPILITVILKKTSSNFFVVFRSPRGKILYIMSYGKLRFTDGKRNSPHTAGAVAKKAAKIFLAFAKKKDCYIHLHSPLSGFTSLVLKKFIVEGIKVKKLRKRITAAHNGCRPRKSKRTLFFNENCIVLCHIIFFCNVAKKLP